MVWKLLFWAWLLFTVLYGGFGLILYLMQSKFLYCPVKELCYWPDELGLDFENVSFTTSDNIKLHGWYVPATDSNYCVLFCHGNGGNIMHRLDSIQFFNNTGLSCFIFDYRGYGKSKGKPSEQGTYLDAQAAWDWLTREKGIQPQNIIIFGRSLGGSIAANLARKVECASLVLESTFTSYVDMGKKFYWYMPVRWFAQYRYNTLESLKEVNCPVLIIHSPDDEVVPYEFAAILYAAANEPKQFLEISGGHNDGFLVSGEIYRAGWLNWLTFLNKQKARADLHRAS